MLRSIRACRKAPLSGMNYGAASSHLGEGQISRTYLIEPSECVLTRLDYFLPTLVCTAVTYEISRPRNAEVIKFDLLCPDRYINFPLLSFSLTIQQVSLLVARKNFFPLPGGGRVAVVLCVFMRPWTNSSSLRDYQLMRPRASPIEISIRRQGPALISLLSRIHPEASRARLVILHERLYGRRGARENNSSGHSA